MKKIFILTFLLIGLIGCKPNQAERAAKIIEKEYKALNKNNAVKYMKYQHRYETAKEMVNKYQHTQSYQICSRCYGYGVLYLVDDYGYPVLDQFGQYRFTPCPICDGHGYVVY